MTEDLAVLDADQHLVEYAGMWIDHVDPTDRSLALYIEDDDLGYPWLKLDGRKLLMPVVQEPGMESFNRPAIERAARSRRESKPVPYQRELRDEYWNPARRRDHLATMGVVRTNLYPHLGLVWERSLWHEPEAMQANMRAHNRWMVSVQQEGRGALMPSGMANLADVEFAVGEVRALAAGGVRMISVAPTLAGDVPLSHESVAPFWASVEDHGLAVIFHVTSAPPVIDSAWFTDDRHFAPQLNMPFTGVAPQLCLSDMIYHGVFDRHPGLRIGVIECGAHWVPEFLGQLDRGYEFYRGQSGHELWSLGMEPSDYIRRHVRVSTFPRENPAKLIAEAGPLFMFGSDFPHPEGCDSVSAYRTAGGDVADGPAARSHFNESVAWLVGAP